MLGLSHATRLRDGSVCPGQSVQLTKLWRQCTCLVYFESLCHFADGRLVGSKLFASLAVGFPDHKVIKAGSRRIRRTTPSWS